VHYNYSYNYGGTDSRAVKRASWWLYCIIWIILQLYSNCSTQIVDKVVISEIVDTSAQDQVWPTLTGRHQCLRVARWKFDNHLRPLQWLYLKSNPKNWNASKGTFKRTNWSRVCFYRNALFARNIHDDDDDDDTDTNTNKDDDDTDDNDDNHTDDDDTDHIGDYEYDEDEDDDDYDDDDDAEKAKPDLTGQWRTIGTVLNTTTSKGEPQPQSQWSNQICALNSTPKYLGTSRYFSWIIIAF